MTSTAVIRRRRRVVWRALADRVVTCRCDPLMRGDDSVHHLFGAAAIVWLVLDQPMDVAAIERQLYEHEVDSVPPTALQHATDTLLGHDLIEVTDQ